MFKNKGFTIMEVLIALAILVIIGAMTAVIFKGTQKSYMRSKSFQHVLSLARDSLDVMRSEIESAFVDTRGVIRFLGVDSGNGNIKAGSTGDEIFFCAPDGSSETGGIAEIGFWQRSDGMLMRHYDANCDFNFNTTDRDDPMGLVVKNLNFEYFDGENFVPDWDSTVRTNEEGLFPKSVRFSFTVEDENGSLSKEFSTIVQINTNRR